MFGTKQKSKKKKTKKNQQQQKKPKHCSEYYPERLISSAFKSRSSKNLKGFRKVLKDEKLTEMKANV